MQPPVNGTDERLDALLDEIKALRADLARVQRPAPLSDGTVALREPAPSPGGPSQVTVPHQPLRESRPQKRGRR